MDKKAALALAGTDKQISDLNLVEIGATLATMEAHDQNEITSEYQMIKPGETIRAFFVEIKQINKKGGKPGEKTEAIRILLPDGRFAINADAVVVSSMRDLPKLTPVQIACTGEEQSAMGTYKTFRITKLS